MEIILGGLIIELAITAIIILIFRRFGWNFPNWFRPKWLRDRLNNAINPNPKRLEFLIAGFGR